MLRRLTLGFFTLVCAAAFAACSSSDTTPPSSGGVTGIGPNFATNTLYAASTTQNALEIYQPNPTSSSKPAYQIGGSNTTLSGPQYLAFNAAKQLWTTNYNASTGAASLLEFQTYATGNVIPLATISGGLTYLADPRGIAIAPKSGDIVAANVNPNAPQQNQVLVFGSGAFGDASPILIAGPATGLNSPTGVSTDKSDNIYVANRGNGTITVYALPTPAPAPSSSPTAAPTSNPSASPSPTATPAPVNTNVAPIETITGLGAPTGVAVDGSGNIYVVDPDNGSPSLRVYAPGAAGNAAPMRTVAGSATMLSLPIDVKVDTSGNVYVADAGAGKILVFGPNASGNVAPSQAVPFSVGTLGGIALSP